MKKCFIIFLLIIIVLFTTACNNTTKENNTSKKGRIYEIVSLSDKNVEMFKTIVPKGWTSSISSQNLVNSSHPFVETIVLTNPSKTAKITILSQHSYVENNQYKEGINKEYYTTYLHSMDAKTYLDYFMDKIYNGSTFIKDIEIPSKLSEQLKTFHEMRLETAKNDANSLQSQKYGLEIGIGDEGYSLSKRQYSNNEKYYEATTGVSSISTNLKSSLSSLLDSKSIQWYMPYLIIYEANTLNDYKSNYEDYNFIVANSSFTTDYYAMVEYVSSAIENVYTSYYAEKSKASLDAMNNYIDSNYSSTSSESTQDKVREMWSDVIKEQDNYILEDGTSVKTSIMNDTLAQNGNEIYIGSKAGIPIGFNEVSKGY